MLLSLFYLTMLLREILCQKTYTIIIKGITFHYISSDARNRVTDYLTKISVVYAAPQHLFLQRGNVVSLLKCKQGWEGYFGNVIGYRLLVTTFKMS